MLDVSLGLLNLRLEDSRSLDPLEVTFTVGWLVTRKGPNILFLLAFIDQRIIFKAFPMIFENLF